MTGSTMQRGWNDWTESERARLETAFSAGHAADLWLDEGQGDTRAAEIAMPALYRAASDPRAFLPASLVGRMATDPSLRADFNMLLERVSQCHFPRAAAASSGALTEREANGYKLRLKPSRANAEQVYLLIDLPDHGTARENPPQGLKLQKSDGTILQTPLGAPAEGTIRVVLESASELVEALGDPASQIFLI